MNREEVIRMAEDCGFNWFGEYEHKSDDVYKGALLAFAALVAAAERERCAKECERDLCNRADDHSANYFDGGLRRCAAAIRALP